MTVDPVPFGCDAYQPHERRIRSSASCGWCAARWPCSSSEEMKGEMLPGSSGVSAPMGVQLVGRSR